MSKKDNRKSISVRLDSSVVRKLEAEATSREMSINALVGSIVAERYNPTRCVAEVFRDTKYICVWGRTGATPQIKKLAAHLLEKNQICTACQKTLELMNRVIKAETRLAEDKIIEVPVCTGGADMREVGGKIQLRCMHPDFGENNWREAQTFCTTANRGKPCMLLAWNQITVQGTKDMR